MLRFVENDRSLPERIYNILVSVLL